MKSALALLSVVLFMCITSCNNMNQHSKTKVQSNFEYSGVIQEAIQTAEYTYCKVKVASDEFWIAISKMPVKKSQTLYFNQGLEMKDFHSKELDRTFPSVFFVQEVSTDPNSTKFKAKPSKLTPQKPEIVKNEVVIEKADGGIRIADLYAKKSDYNGKKVKSINLPICFSAKIREDIVAKVLEAKKTTQPYAPSLVAGKQHAAKGKIVHRRHVWRSGYGRGASRVPRKIFSQKGSQFNWEAAEVPFARGGMRAHPPKILSMLNFRKINKKELKIAFESVLSSTANGKEIVKRYSSLEGRKIENAPFVVESKISTLKVKELLESLKKILGKDLFKLAIQKKEIRSGKGKRRGRKYKNNAGLLLVIGEKEKLKTTAFDVVPVNSLGITDLAAGGLGRLTIYTEESIKELNKRLENKK